MQQGLKADMQTDGTAQAAEGDSFPVKARLYRHQTDAANFAMKSLAERGGAALLMEMGTGKTLTAIAIAGKLQEMNLIRRVLVTAPLSVLGVWRDEFRRFAGFGYELHVLEGTTEKKKAALTEMKGEMLQVVCVNYESCWRLERELYEWNPDLIICDEGHRIKTPTASASKTMHLLARQAPYRLLLTGTVIVNKPIDVFSQYKFVDPRIFGNSFYQFRSRYFDMMGYGHYTPVMREWMKPEFMGKLHEAAYRVTKAECLDLPETTDMIQRIELEPKARKIYRELEEESWTALSRDTVTATNVLTMMLRLSQMTGGFLIGDRTDIPEQVSAAKLNALKELTENAMENGEKIVIIARFVPEIHAICEMLQKSGIRYAQVSGEVRDRDQQVRKFQEDPGCRVFVGQIATAGLGITLTAARMMVFYSLDYSMANYDQTRARIHRVGQRQMCTYIHLVARDTIDERVLAALKAKRNIAKELVDEARRKQRERGGNHERQYIA